MYQKSTTYPSIITKKLFLLLGFLWTTSICIQVSAQKKGKEENSTYSEPVAKIEQILNKDENKNYEVMVLESKRIALISDEAGDITVSIYDQDLRKAATINLKGPGKGFGMNKKISSGDKIYFLFTDNRYNRANVGSGRLGFKKFVVVQVDLNTKKQVTVDGVFEKLFTMESMTESDGRIVLAGTHTYKNSTQIFRLCLTAGLCYIPYFFGSLDFPTWIDMAVLDFGKKKCNIETLDFGEKPKISLVASNFSGEKNGSIIVRNKVKKRKYQTNLYPVSIGSSVKMNDPVMLDPGAEKNIWNCKVNYNNEQNRVVIGTYSQLKSSNVGGFYISELNNKKVNWQLTIPLEVLFKNEYNKNKKNEKSKKGKSGTAKIQGISYEYVGTHQYLFHDVMESENEYLFIAESYYPTYHTETRITYVNGKPQTTTVQVFDGYVYSKGVVFLTDKKGKLIWSNIVDLPYYRTFVPTKQFVSISSAEDDLIISVFRTFSFTNYKVDGTGNMEQMESNQVKFGNKKDDITLRMSNSEFWYDNYYVMSGIATIKTKKSKLKSEKSSKFYVYKMEVGKELSQEPEE